MKKLLIINSSINTTSTGRIAEEIGDLACHSNFEVFVAYGRNFNSSSHKALKIGSKIDVLFHGVQSLLFDNHGFGSKNATINFIKQIDQINPDIIHIHNLHGYYIHIGVLFEYLRTKNKPVVWTFHDCWPFTGHCSYFDSVNCVKWKTCCSNCPNQQKYPKSLFFDFSKRNFQHKKEIITSLDNIVVSTPSNWLNKIVRNSYFNKYKVVTINNGIDLNKFKPVVDFSIISKYNISKQKNIIVGVASIWDSRKGLNDFIEIRKYLENNVLIVLIGLSEKQIMNLPAGIIGISRTESVDELAAFYSLAKVFVNPTYVDNFPTTNLEALACGTPVITYNTGGSPEAIDPNTGIVVEKGDINNLIIGIKKILSTDKEVFTKKCVDRAKLLYDKNNRFNDYINIYNELLNQ